VKGVGRFTRPLVHKVAIAVAEIVADLINEMPNEHLIEKYHLAENDLQSFFDEFLRAMAAGRSQIELKSEE
jgi:replicative superfamily II helicase